MPTLDTCDLLPRLVFSLQAQTWKQWRLLFVDGNSGPKHRKWLQQTCAHEPRCLWINEDPTEPGIFGAMNQGFAAASPVDWVLFWGSDDWAASANVFSTAMETVHAAAVSHCPPDLIVCRALYINNGIAVRASSFVSGDRSRCTTLDRTAYRRALLLGSTPPHQATLFGPRARQHLGRYESGFRLSADLDYFLQLSNFLDLSVQCLELELVHIAPGGISAQQTRRRLREVRYAYVRTFGWLWWLPFLTRYLKRISSLLLSL